MSEATSAKPESVTPRRGVGHIVHNAFALGSSQALTLVASAVVALVLPRYLGAEHLGKFAFASAYTTYFLLATNLGVTTHLTKELARDPGRAASYTANSIFLRLPIAVFAALMGVLLINVIGADTLTKQTIYIMSAGMVLTTLYDIVVASLQGLQKMRPIAVSQVLLKVSFGVSVTVLLVTGHGLIAVAVASTASVLAGLFIPAIVLFGHLRHPEHRKLGIGIDTRVWKTLVLGGLPFLVWQASLVIYGKVDMLMLGIFTQDEVIGWYAAAYRLTSLHTFIPTIVMTATLPALVAAAKDDRASFNMITRRAFQVVIVGTLPIAVGTLLLADKFIDFFDYPSEFSHSVPLVIILALHSPFVAADMIIGTAVIAGDRQKQWAMTGVAAAALNPALNLLLIPLTDSWYGNGATGAAVATLATELFMMVMGLRLLGGGIIGAQSARMVARALVSVAAMAAVVTLLRDAPIYVPVAAGAVTYSLAIFAFRAIQMDDIKRTLRHLTSRGRIAATESPADTTTA
jgi:O-antigen/teichoic acid export membrane protein